MYIGDNFESKKRKIIKVNWKDSIQVGCMAKSKQNYQPEILLMY